MNFVLRLFLLLCLLAGGTAVRAESVAVPVLSARVTDLAGTLDAGQKAALEDKLAGFEKVRGSQIAVLIVPGTQPETIEQYSMRVAEAWKVGRKGQDDGVILVVARNEHKLRIEVGYGLEGALPDAVCRRIIAEDIAPRFKAGDWAGGLDAGVDRIQALIAGEKLAPPAASAKAAARNPDWEGMLVPGIFAVVILGGILAKVLGRLLGSLATGGLAGFVLLFVSGSLVLALAAGFVIFLLSLILSGRGGNWHSGSGWSGGGSSSGWSGGGGGFGGGGASGDW
ncbi:MAG: TPM domain-containing protein [Rhodocyclaceae bacterium]|nr:TPM domain-containing protein [Rhodocyclaceae bacterium]